MKSHHAAVRFSFYTAVISFITAVTIFAIFFFSGDLIYAFIGHFAFLILGLVNVIALVILGAVMSKNPSIRRIGSTTILFQLFNIPVAIFFFWAGAHLVCIERITLINETGIELHDLKITGCEEENINHLSPGSSETVWISIPHDCSVSLEYLQGDSIVKCSVAGYLTPNSGGVSTYRIGGKNEPIW